METTMTAENQTKTFISPEDLLNNYLGHRGLTRRTIEAFPEEQFFSYSIGGMRPFAEMVMELLGIAAPGLKQIATGETPEFKEHFDHQNSKELILKLWDESTEEIKKYWSQIPADGWDQPISLFGQWEFPVYFQICYFLDNEIHHRGQAYVYLRSLGIEPPAFYER